MGQVRARASEGVPQMGDRAGHGAPVPARRRRSPHGGALMDFWVTLVGLLRRKRVLIPAVLVALTTGSLVYLATPTTYVSDTTMVLTTTPYGGTESQDPDSPTDLTNPMLNFSDSLRTTAGILISSMNTEAVEEQLGVRKPARLFVDDGRTNPDLLGLNGPFLYVVATSPSPEEAARIVDEAQQLMREKLAGWQSQLNAPQRTYISIADVVQPVAPDADRAKAVKLGVIALVLGFLIVWDIAYLLQRSRRGRRARPPGTEAAQEPALFPWPVVNGRKRPPDGAVRVPDLVLSSGDARGRTDPHERE